MPTKRKARSNTKRETTMEQREVGAKIRRFRERKAWTQEHLAQAARIAPRTVQRAEEGVLSAESLSAIAGALDVPVEKLSAVKPPPEKWPRIAPAVFYVDPNAAIDWLERAFGFEARLKVPGADGRIMHSELELHEGVIMVAGSWADRFKSPREVGGMNTISLTCFVEDVDEHFERARKAGAKIMQEPDNAHGMRRYRAQDPEGHEWCFCEHLSRG
jgi:uncharacterized glyoxalase superfamily protein PhnB/DNA-binding XRE family transcriptional regulator